MHQGPDPPPNTLLTVDLPHCRPPHSPWTCPTTEHPTHHRPAPPRNTLFIVDLLHRRTQYSPWTFANVERQTHRGPAPSRNILLPEDLPHHGTPYSQWTCPKTAHPTHLGLPHLEHPTHSTEEDLWKKLHLMAQQQTPKTWTLRLIGWNGLGVKSVKIIFKGRWKSKAKQNSSFRRGDTKLKDHICLCMKVGCKTFFIPVSLIWDQIEYSKKKSQG